MNEQIKPLKECVVACKDKVGRYYDAMSVERLLQEVADADFRFFFDTAESDQMDEMRVVLWFVNAALTRKGIAPAYRTSLGPMPRKLDRFCKVQRMQDGPYCDLQWLGFKHPELLPPRLSAIQSLHATASGAVEAEDSERDAEGDIYIGATIDADNDLDQAFAAADRLVNRKMSVARKCMNLKLSPAVQSEMRWLCSATTRKLLADIDSHVVALRAAMKAQAIKQLKPAHVERRILTFRAWKLSGGGTNWQATAHAFEAMTGDRISRQAIRDMITRLSSRKLVRLRKGRKKTHGPVLADVLCVSPEGEVIPSPSGI
jgi:hypothetical protein